jgi:NAD(P)-dependent dehydrogenase (short-subunit alcohol dehydrogenase family)|tara:strand:+ start:395 stop:1111 length:717 start_codon:yes stop_codon:yes gene_type:complete
MSDKYLIFGATGSIGSNLALRLHESGKDAILIGRNEEELKSIASKTKYEYENIDVLSDDISTIVKDKFANKDISGLAYCVGSIDLKPLRATKKEDFEKCMKLNFYPIVDVIKSLQETLKKNNGSIVLFSTVAVQRGFTNHSIIASIKGAVEGLTVSLAAEFAPNIRVNCIAPSLTNSKISNSILKNKLIADGIAKAHPMKRIGEGKDAAAMAKFLLTEESSWITGQIFGVDGGRGKLS